MGERHQIPKTISGPGNKILSDMVKPLLSDAIQYDRVSAFYNPKSILLLLQEFSEIWKKRGKIRLIIGFHENLKITPALRKDLEIKKAITEAVYLAMHGIISELFEIIQKEHKELIPVLRELLKKNAIQIRLVTPKVNFNYYKANGKWPTPEIGLFHSKFSIIHHKLINERDKNHLFKFLKRDYYRPSILRLSKGEEFTAICGSFNESMGGYGKNIEDAVLFHSYKKEERDVAKHFVDRFEALWTDAATDVVTMPFDEEFKLIIKSIIEIKKPKEVRWFKWNKFLEIINSSPIYCGLFQPNLSLLPHQLRVYREALSRWPVRILLADEVGLGKTIEAGSIIRYLAEHSNIKKIAILTPASLRYQWQKELNNLFNLKFWVYNSYTGECELENKKMTVKNKPLLGPDHIIISWHWAKMNVKKNSCRFEDSELPDLLIVDEVHHARRKIELDGQETQTQLFLLLKQLSYKIPHILLLTATPFQTCQLDYFSILELLGLPKWFNEDELENFSKWTRGKIAENYNFNVKQIKQVHNTIKNYNINNVPIFSDLCKIPLSDDTKVYEKYHDELGKLSRQEILSVHPTTLFTLRNSRSILKKIGYKFPKVHLSGPEIYITEKQEDWFDDLENYIKKRLGDTESLGNTKKGIGRLRSLYRQRVVSSIVAAKDSLQQRKRALTKFAKTSEIKGLKITLGEEFNAAKYDPEDSDPNLEYKTQNQKQFENQTKWAKDEIYHLERLIRKLNELFSQENVIVDPKMERLKEIVNEHVGSGRRVIIFSRFTSTTAAIIDELRNFADTPGLGRYDGEVVGVYKLLNSKLKLVECNKQEIINNLKSGKIKILVCSDAASEGLNLHSANVAINVDVPWSPSRLLQRFGRVDRLGQLANDVFLINMYYPNSIEERMYSVLEDRRLDFRSVLGEVPEILSEQQQRLIDSYSNGSSFINLTYEDIQDARRKFNENQYQHLILKDNLDDKHVSIENKFLETIKRSANKKNMNISEIGYETVEINNEIISIDPVSDFFIKMNSEYWNNFECFNKEETILVDLYSLHSKNNKPLFLCLKDKEHLIPLATKDWDKLFEFIFLGKSIDMSKLSKYEFNNLNDLLKYFRKNENWIWPDHYYMKCMSEIITSPPEFNRLKLGENLGKVSIIK